jgi:hypothetical protein
LWRVFLLRGKRNRLSRAAAATGDNGFQKLDGPEQQA